MKILVLGWSSDEEAMNGKLITHRKSTDFTHNLNHMQS